MTNLDPAEYKNGQPITTALSVGETVDSSSPKVTLGKSKAVVAAVGGALVGGLTALGVALADEVVTSGEWVAVALAVVVGTGLVGGATFVAPTTVTRNR